MNYSSQVKAPVLASDNLFSLSLDRAFNVSFEISLIAVVVIISIVGIIFYFIKKSRFGIDEIEIDLFKSAKIKITPNITDMQIAHKLWTELITRKVALPYDKEHDVIHEVYNSWYVLFSTTRELISEIPIELIRKEKSTQKLVTVMIDALNIGLRPHLTEWQAKYRVWYNSQAKRLELETPQEIQKSYDFYDELVEDLIKVNNVMSKYADDLKKISMGKN